MTIEPYKPMTFLSRPGLRYGDVDYTKLTVSMRSILENQVFTVDQKKSLRGEDNDTRNVIIFGGFLCSSGILLAGTLTIIASYFKGVEIGFADTLIMSVCAVLAVVSGTFLYCVIRNGNRLQDRLDLQLSQYVSNWINENSQVLISASHMKILSAEWLDRLNKPRIWFDESEISLFNFEQMIGGYPENLVFLNNIKCSIPFNDKYMRNFFKWFIRYRNSYLQRNESENNLRFLFKQRNFQRVIKKVPELLDIIEKDHPHMILEYIAAIEETVDITESISDQDSPPIAETSSDHCLKSQLLEFIADIENRDVFTSFPEKDYNIEKVEMMPLLESIKYKYHSTSDRRLFLQKLSEFCDFFRIKTDSQMTFYGPLNTGEWSFEGFDRYWTLMAQLENLQSPKEMTIHLKQGAIQVDRQLLIEGSLFMKRKLSLSGGGEISLDEDMVTFHTLISAMQQGFDFINDENVYEILAVACKYLAEGVIAKCAVYYAKNFSEESFSTITHMEIPFLNWKEETLSSDYEDILESFANLMIVSKNQKETMKRIQEFFAIFRMGTGDYVLRLKLLLTMNQWERIQKWPLQFDINRYSQCRSLLQFLNPNDEHVKNFTQRFQQYLNNLLECTLSFSWDQAVLRQDTILKEEIAKFCQSLVGQTVLSNEYLRHSAWLVSPDELAALIQSLKKSFK